MRELLLCPPDYYGIEYEINPWMSRARGAESELAKSQWEGLRQTLASLDSKIELVPPQPKLPDMVFTANAGLTVGKKFIPSNFRYPERAGEAPYFRRWMEEHGYETVWLPDNLYFEGEGDALFSNDTLFCGYKFRSDIQSHRAVGELLRCLVISVELVDPRSAVVNTSSGDVEISGSPNALAVSTSSGDVEVDDVSDSLRIETTSGDVSIENAARGGTVSTNSGEVSIRSISGRFSVTTVSGEIRTRIIAPLQEASFATSSGDIRLGIDSKVACRVEMRTTSGSLDLGVPVRTQTLTRRLVTGVIRDGVAPLRLRSTSGSIALVSGEP